MRVKICVLLFLLLSTNSFAQSIKKFVGTWEGTIQVGVELRVIFHIKDDGHGKLTATTDSPDQAAYGMPCDSVYANGMSLSIEMRKLRANYFGRLTDDSTLTGTFIQGTAIPLTLKKVEKISERKRPQTPKPPFPYYSYDVEYDNADRSVHFGATLTIPKPDSNIRYIKAPEYPVALMITGSGAQDRDETILGHKPFAVIADYLSRQGFAVLRVDDRGVGKTTGSKKATSADFANDVEAGIEYLKTRSEIDKNKIGLIGHSEGGMIAPMVASRREDINFIILLAGPGIKIIDLMAEQNAAVIRSSGVDSNAADKFIPLYKKVIAELLKYDDTSKAKMKAYDQMERWAKKTDAKTKEELGFADINGRKKYVDEIAPVLSTPWFRYFISFDPQPYLRQLKCRVLALDGSRDIQVISRSNLAGIQASLKKSSVITYETKELPGLNHLFQSCTRCDVTEYGELEESFSPVALKIIGDWLNKNVK